MGNKDWIEGAKEIVIGALVIEKSQEYWMNAYVFGGFVDSISPSFVKVWIEAMLALLVISLVVFGIYLILRGMRTSLTNW